MRFVFSARYVLPAAPLLTMLGFLCPVPAQGQVPASAAPPLPTAAPDAPTILVRSVLVEGARAIPPTVVAQAASDVIVNKLAGRENLRTVSETVRGLYRNKGFRLAQVVTVEVDAATGVLRVSVVEGTVSRIVVKGNKHTRTKTILSALSLRAGDVYEEKRIRNDRNRLDRLGIFSEVSITARVPGTPDEPPVAATDNNASSDGAAVGADVQKATGSPSAGASGIVPTAQSAPAVTPPPVSLPDIPDDAVVGQLELVVRVKERSTVSVAATVGYSDGAGAVGFAGVSEDNVAGLGQRASVQWQRTARGTIQPDGSVRNRDSRAAFNLTYDAPPLGRKATGIGVDVYQKNTVFLPYFSGDQTTLRSYEKRRGATVRGLRTLGDNLSGFVSYRHDAVGYDAIPSELNPPYGDLARARATVAALGIGLVDDARDRAENPRTGFLHSITYESANRVFGGDRNFGQTTVDLREYAPLLNAPATPNGSENARTPIIAVRFLGGFSTGDVPLSENYFLGGYDLLRGYDLFSIRGTRMLMGTGEVRVPLGGGTQAVVFSDAGNAWQSGQRVSFSGLKVGAGAGLRFLTPIGPIRFDAAYGSRLRTYVTLGQSF